MMGLSNWLHWTAWFVKYFLFLLVSVAIETVLFIINTGKNGSIIGYTSGGVLFIFLLSYTLATISFCFAVSTFFSRGVYIFVYLKQFTAPYNKRFIWLVLISFLLMPYINFQSSCVKLCILLESLLSNNCVMESFYPPQISLQCSALMA